jgi:hypothetical protein
MASAIPVSFRKFLARLDPSKVWSTDDLESLCCSITEFFKRLFILLVKEVFWFVDRAKSLKHW